MILQLHFSSNQTNVCSFSISGQILDRDETIYPKQSTVRTPIEKRKELSITRNYFQPHGCSSSCLPFEDERIENASRMKLLKDVRNSFRFRIMIAVPTIRFPSFTAKSFGVFLTNAGFK